MHVYDLPAPEGPRSQRTCAGHSSNASRLFTNGHSGPWGSMETDRSDEGIGRVRGAEGLSSQPRESRRESGCERRTREQVQQV
eukprot:scaffold244995_cov32-Tisochrysis_lutea.AAC.5